MDFAFTSDRTNRPPAADEISGEDHYSVLGVTRTASKTQIREAYIRLQNTFGNQSQAFYSLLSDDEAHRMMRKIELAFRILNDERSKNEYDGKMGWSTENSSLSESDRRKTSPAKNPFETQERPQSLETEIDASGEAIPLVLGDGAKKQVAGVHPSEALIEGMIRIIATSEPGDGKVFKQLRELANVSDHEIQERTKISIGYIHAIEATQFERLPSFVFVKGFLRSYLRYLKAPQAEELVTAFMTRYQDWLKREKRL